LIASDLRLFLPCRDLNGDGLQGLVLRRPTMVHEPGPHGVFSVAEFPAGSRVSPLRRSVRRRRSTTRLLLLGSVSVDGLCSTHLSRWASRYRSVLAISGRQTLPYGFSRPRGPLHAGRRQRLA